MCFRYIRRYSSFILLQLLCRIQEAKNIRILRTRIQIRNTLEIIIISAT